MSQGGYVTLVGFVAREPMLRNTKDGTSVADVRIGTTARYLDRENGVWRDGETCYYTVNCWRRLADNVRASLHKGDPVVVKGRFRTRTYTDREGMVKTEAEIVADSVGHDLSRGIANFIRPPKARPEAAAEMAAGEIARSGLDEYTSQPERYTSQSEGYARQTEEYAGQTEEFGGQEGDPDGANGPDDSGEDPMPVGAGVPPFADSGSGVGRIDEDTVEVFASDIVDDDAVARELGAPEETIEPAVPF